MKAWEFFQDLAEALDAVDGVYIEDQEEELEFFEANGQDPSDFEDVKRNIEAKKKERSVEVDLDSPRSRSVSANSSIASDIEEKVKALGVALSPRLMREESDARARSESNVSVRSLDSKEGDNIAVERINLEGKKLFSDLLKDINSAIDSVEEEIDIAPSIQKRFEATITDAIKAVGLDDLINNDLEELFKIDFDPSLEEELTQINNNIDKQPMEKWAEIKECIAGKKVDLEGIKEAKKFIADHEKDIKENKGRVAFALRDDEREELSKKIQAAVDEFSLEIDKQNKPGVLWNYENSLTAAERQRSVFNVVGKFCDTIGSMCHSIGKAIGLSRPTAAELFQEAAKYAHELRANLTEQQLERSEVRAKEAEGSNISYYDMKQRGLDNSSEAKFQKKLVKHSEDQNAKIAANLKEQFGADVADSILKRVGNVGKRISAPEFVVFETDVQKKLETLYQTCKDIKNKDLHTAIGKVQEALFIQDVVIEGKTHKGKVDVRKAHGAIKDLGKIINEAGVGQEEFNQFKAEVDKIPRNDKWAGRVLSEGKMSARAVSL